MKYLAMRSKRNLNALLTKSYIGYVGRADSQHRNARLLENAQLVNRMAQTAGDHCSSSSANLALMDFAVVSISDERVLYKIIVCVDLVLMRYKVLLS